MPYKRPESSYWQVRRKRLPGYGDTGLITSKSKRRRVAERMERLLEELANKALLDPKWTDLIDAVVERDIDLPILLKAKNRGRLEALLQSLHDPLLSGVVERFREERDPGRHIGYGLDRILELTPPKARLSHLQDGRTVTDLCHESERVHDLQRNTVHRQLLRAISKILREEIGTYERDRVFADVYYEREDDTREVLLTPAQIRRLLSACDALDYHELRVVTLTALLTSADRGVLLAGEHPDGIARGLLKGDLKIFEEDGTLCGEAHLLDKKADGRRRTVPFGDRLARELLLCVEGKASGEPVFDMKYSQLDYRWAKAREEASLEHVRFKDLRAQTAIYAQRAGVPQAVTQSVMGHRSQQMTRRYQQHQASMTEAQADRLESAMFNGV